MPEVRAKRYRLLFEDQPGLEMVVRSVPLSVLLSVEGSAVDLLARIERGDVAPANASREAASLGIAAFVDAIESWNLEVDGLPLPISVESLLSLPDPTIVQAAVTQWRDMQTKVPDADPLPKPSNGGAPSPGVSIPMVPL